jgi:ABC-type nitrate/sulfonate/bicarbonate transport system substrate-binding protein
MLSKSLPAIKAIAHSIWRNKAIAILLVLLAGILIISAPSLNFTAGGPVTVGILREPNAYCAFTEINSNDPRYSISIMDEYPALISALKEGRLDAAILPVQYLKEFTGNEISALAATSLLNLVVVENGSTVYTLTDLNGRSVIMSKSDADSMENQMLNLLLSKANIDVNISYESDEAIAKMARESTFELMILKPYECAQVLLENDSYRSCFNLINQWYSLLGTQPPAGCLIVARNEIVDAKASDLSTFLAGVKASISFINDKHKKAATLIAQSGLGEDTVTILKAIPHFMYNYLDGNSLTESLEQLKQLS